jgi:hypothetical protein
LVPWSRFCPRRTHLMNTEKLGKITIYSILI